MNNEIKMLTDEQKTLKKRLSLVNSALNALHKVYGKSTDNPTPLKRAKRGPYKKHKNK